MSRFDDELRRAIAPMAEEPLPDGVLDEALDAAPARTRWAGVAGAVTAAIVLAIAAGIGFGELLPSPLPSASPSVAPSGSSAGSCTHIVAPAGGEDVVTVFFPCGATDSLEMGGGTRSVGRNLDLDGRLDAALRAVLDGPTELERSVGMSGVVPTGSADLLTSVTVWPDGLAQVDFASGIGEVADLSERARADTFTRALRETALHFEELTAVELRIDGSCDDFFALLGEACQHLAEPVAWAGDCPIVPPAELPSGAEITVPRAYPGEPKVSWGSDGDTVTETIVRGESIEPDPSAQVTVTQRREPKITITSNEADPPLVGIHWTEDGCAYRIALLMTMDRAPQYAQRFGLDWGDPQPTASPTDPAPPAEPVANSIEDQGVRLTLALDRDRISFGERTWADVTVENIGADIVYWGHSSTCVFAAAITAFPDVSEEVPYGRDDWPGESGTLKSITVFEGLFNGHGFTPEEWVDFEGNFACTSDLVTSEVNPGDVLTYRAAWDGDATYGMPVTPGSYHVDATFNFMSRGAPAAEARINEHAVSVSVPMNVDGPAIDYLAPGEAVDRILDDSSFQDLLADAPMRDRWAGSDLAFLEGNWVLSLRLSEPTEAIVATVDGVSGQVIRVEIDPDPDPPGG